MVLPMPERQEKPWLSYDPICHYHRRVYAFCFVAGLVAATAPIRLVVVEGSGFGPDLGRWRRAH